MSRQYSSVGVPLAVATAFVVMILMTAEAQEVNLQMIVPTGEAPAGEAREVKLQNPVERTPGPVIDPFVLELQERTFRFFWDTANSENGLVPDRYPTPSYSSIAAVGFGLTTYPIGVERGYITRQQAQQRVLTTLRFLSKAPQGADARGAAGHRGFFYHFLDMKTGERFEDSELSTVDTAILLAGALFCQSYFTGSDPEEVEIRALVDEIYRRVDWRVAPPQAPPLHPRWGPPERFLGEGLGGFQQANPLVPLWPRPPPL